MNIEIYNLCNVYDTRAKTTSEYRDGDNVSRNVFSLVVEAVFLFLLSLSQVEEKHFIERLGHFESTNFPGRERNCGADRQLVKISRESLGCLSVLSVHSVHCTLVFCTIAAGADGGG